MNMRLLRLTPRPDNPEGQIMNDQMTLATEGGCPTGLSVPAGSACCDRPAVVVMDYTAENVRKVNRVCTRCWTHWHGLEGSVRQYTKKQWDTLIEDWRNENPVDWAEVRQTEDPRVVLRAMLAIWDPCDESHLDGWGAGEIDLIMAARRILGVLNTAVRHAANNE
jgi:hypothetical protein